MENTAKFTIDAKAFKAAVVELTKHTPRSSLPVLQCIRVDSTIGDLVMLTATNLEVTVTATLPAKVTAAGTDLFNANDLKRALTGVKGDVDVNGTQFTAEGMTTNLPGAPLDEWPTTNGATATEYVWPDLAGLFGRILPAVSKDYARPILCAVCLDGATNAVVGTNSYCLSFEDIDIPGDARTLILREAAEIVVRKMPGDVTCRFDERMSSFTANGWHVECRNVEGVFPNWRGLIPADPQCKVIVDAAEIVKVAKAAKKATRDAIPAALQRHGDKLVVSVTTDSGQFRADVNAAFTGNFPMVVGINPGYWLDMLTTATDGTGTVTVALVDANKPMVWTGSTCSQGLAMPVRDPKGIEFLETLREEGVA